MAKPRRQKQAKARASSVGGWDAIMSGRDRSFKARALRIAGDLAEPFHMLASRLRNTAFDRGWRKARRAHCPVISVGNLTTGGTGKTPTVIYIASLLRDRGLYPAVVLRGYKAAGEVGSDEALLLQERLSTPVIVEADRVAAAAQIQADFPEVNCIVLDDGFQHRRLVRDLDVVLIDATNPFGYGRQLPRGMLRESAKSLARASAVVVTRSNHIKADARQKLDNRIRRFHGAVPVAHATHHWDEIADDYNDIVDDKNAPVVLLCAIGNPAAFVRQAETRFKLVERMIFPDHHDYQADEAATALAHVERTGARAILTTEKDWTKLQQVIKQVSDDPPPIWMPRLTLGFVDGQAEFDQLVLNTVFDEPEK